MMRPTLTAVLILCFVFTGPATGQQQRQRRERAKPRADAPATQPEETTDDEPQEPLPPRSDLRRSRLSSDVDRAIRKATKFLVSRQLPNGAWAVENEREEF